MNREPTAILGDAFERLEQAWNDADGARYGEIFSDDAHFVDIRGERHRGPSAIARGHQAIFDTVYKGSKVEYSVLDADRITDECLFGVMRARLEAPSGPLQGIHHSTISALLLDGGNGWKVRAFHNTLIAE